MAAKAKTGGTPVRLTLTIAGLGDRDDFVVIDDPEYAAGLIAQEFAIEVKDDDPETSIVGHGDGNSTDQGDPAADPNKT